MQLTMLVMPLLAMIANFTYIVNALPLETPCTSTGVFAIDPTITAPIIVPTIARSFASAFVAATLLPCNAIVGFAGAPSDCVATLPALTATATTAATTPTEVEQTPIATTAAAQVAAPVNTNQFATEQLDTNQLNANQLDVNQLDANANTNTFASNRLDFSQFDTSGFNPQFMCEIVDTICNTGQGAEADAACRSDFAGICGGAPATTLTSTVRPFQLLARPTPTPTGAVPAATLGATTLPCNLLFGLGNAPSSCNVNFVHPGVRTTFVTAASATPVV